MFDELPGRTPDEVLNQPPPLQDYNLLAGDTPLVEALRREGGGWVEEQALEYGAVLGRSETLRLGELANRHVPELRTHDRFGQRIDEVEFHPAWHQQMRLGIESRCHSLPWTTTKPGAHVARVVLCMLRHQIDEGPSCPITMTFAALPCLRLQPELAAEWEPRLLSDDYDPRFLPADKKRGALFGMLMTEQGTTIVSFKLYRITRYPINQGRYTNLGVYPCSMDTFTRSRPYRRPCGSSYSHSRSLIMTPTPGPDMPYHGQQTTE